MRPANLWGGELRSAVRLRNPDQRKKEKEVNNNCIKQFRGGRTVRSIIGGLLVAAAVLAVTGIASAQDKKSESASLNLIRTPTTPTAITPRVGNVLFLAGHAFG